MAYPVWVEIVCDTCSVHGTGQWTYRGIPRATLAKAARADKWRQVGDDWFCPRCHKKRLTELTAKT